MHGGVELLLKNVFFAPLYYTYNIHSYPYEEYIRKISDWLNAHHLDYRGLIEKGLALEAPEGIYKIE